MKRRNALATLLAAAAIPVRAQSPMRGFASVAVFGCVVELWWAASHAGWVR
jgi:hypothetical protein